MGSEELSDSTKKNVVSRRHVTTACTSCRDTKSKCDGMRPTCGQCIIKNRDCVYRMKIDKRKISLRKTVELFCRRVKLLENILSSHGIAVPDMASKDDQAMLLELMAAYATTCKDQDDPVNVAHRTAMQSLASPQDSIGPVSDHCDPSLGMAANFVSSNYSSCVVDTNVGLSQEVHAFGDATDEFSFFDPCSEADWIWNFSSYAPFQLSGDPGFGFSTFATQPNQMFLEIPPEGMALQTPVSAEEVEITDEEELPEVTYQFSDRLGSLLTTPNGETRFYGATSNLHLVDNRRISNSSPTMERHRVRKLLKLHGLGEDVDAQLLVHLMTLYFTWQNPTVQVVNQEVFEAARDGPAHKQSSSIYYSDLLVNAMCAVGALQCRSRHAERLGPLPQFFAKRARALLDNELDCPQISTVQALAILSLYESATAKDTRGWLLSGMAMRLALDLGLHVSAKSYVQNGSMSRTEAEVRRTTFWGTYAIDRMWGIYLGRPLHLKFADFTVEKPDIAAHGEDARLWVSYESVTGVPKDESLLDCQNTIAERWIALLEIMSSLGHMLYSKIDASKIELQSLAEQTFDSLLAWESTLPDQIALNMDTLDASPRLPHVLMLHMHYALFMIVLHRPFVSKHYIQPSPRVGRGHMHAREMCVRSAINISKLTSCYKRQYDLDRCSVLVVHPIFSAALILVYATVSENNSDVVNSLQPHLETCCQALAELGNTFDNAARSLDILLAVKRTWQARMVVGFQGKRPNSGTLAAPKSVARKRARTSVTVS